MAPPKPGTYEEAIRFASELFEDLSYSYAAAYKEADPARRVIGFLPIYVPREILHAAAMLPVGLFGAGDRIPVVRGDAYFQSYICHLPRTVVELLARGHLDHFDGFLFPSICDVIRNLSGVFRLHTGGKLVRYVDFPQNFDPAVGGAFYRGELERLVADLGALGGTEVDAKALNRSIGLYNRNRRLLGELDALRLEEPHKLPAADGYLVRRAGQILSVEDHNAFLERVIGLARASGAEREDKIRVVVSGSFCEQPPLGLIRTIENAGCYIVGDDFQLGLEWFGGAIGADTDDPLGALVSAYLSESHYSSALYENEKAKGDLLAADVLRCRADGVIFCAPSFCDPALLDRPLLEQAMDRNHIKHSSFQYHENLGQFHVIREQAGTFADMIKLWE